MTAGAERARHGAGGREAAAAGRADPISSLYDPIYDGGRHGGGRRQRQAAAAAATTRRPKPPTDLRTSGVAQMSISQGDCGGQARPQKWAARPPTTGACLPAAPTLTFAPHPSPPPPHDV